MKRMLLAATMIVLIAVTVALIPAMANAATKWVGTGGYTVRAGQTVNDDVYLWSEYDQKGGPIRIDGRINGNLVEVAAPGTITVNGTVTGTVYAGNETTVIRGTVGGSVLGFSWDRMTVSGTVRHDIVFAGGTLEVLPGASVGRDIAATSDTLIVNGRVLRDVKTGSSSVRIGSTAVIGGSLRYGGDNAPQVAPGAAVHGGITHLSSGVLTWQGFRPSFGYDFWLRNAIGLAILGLLFVLLGPSLSRRSASQLRRSPLGSLGVGVLTVIIVPVLASMGFALGQVIGGWWIGLMLLGGYWLALTLGVAVPALVMGEWLLMRTGRTPPSQVLSVVVGMAVLCLGTLILGMTGFLGAALSALLLLVLATWGFGALVMAGYGSRPSSRQSAPQPLPAAPPSPMPPQGHPA